MDELKKSWEFLLGLSGRLHNRRVDVNRLVQAFRLLRGSCVFPNLVLDKYSPDSQYEKEWTLYYGEVLREGGIGIHDQLRQTARIGEGLLLPVFAWRCTDQGYKRSGGIVKGYGSMRNDLARFGEPEEKYNIQILEARVIVPEGNWDWKTLASHISGDIDGTPFSEFKTVEENARYNGPEFDASLYDASQIDFNLYS